jgi:O-antigen/teichoic acid export membrane protein
LSGIKKLAGQTLWYGVPTIASRFLGYLMNLSLTIYFFSMQEQLPDLTQVYAIIPFLNVLFTYGMETAYFRYSQSEDKKKLYSTLSLSIFFTTIILTACLLLFRPQIADAAGLNKHPQYVTWMCWIIFFDTLATLPFAKLRQEGRPRKYAFVRVGRYRSKYFGGDPCAWLASGLFEKKSQTVSWG